MTKLAVVFGEGFADWECAHLMAAGRAELGLEVAVATPGGAAVISLGGLRVTPDAALEDLSPEGFDGIVFCGGAIWQSPDAPDISGPAHAFADSGRLVGAICDAVMGLAATGRLDAVAHTGNDLSFLKTVPAYGGEARYVETPAAVADGRVVTAAGSAPVSFMVEVLSGLGYERAYLRAYRGILAAEHGAAAS